jgi:hypothetical protein
MPCYDKKLEASRRDFFWERDTMLSSVTGSAPGDKVNASLKDVKGGAEEEDGVKEVDCVLTVTELVELLSGRGGSDEFEDPASVLANLSDVPPSIRHGLLFGSPSASEGPSFPPGAENAPMLEELLCGLTPDGTQFSGGAM